MLAPAKVKEERLPVVGLFPPHVLHRRLPRGGRVWMAGGFEMLAPKLLQAVLPVLVSVLWQGRHWY